MDKYNAATINVDTSGTVITPGFDIENYSVYSTSAITVELYTGTWGDAIPVAAGISFGDNFGCLKIRIKSVAGTVAVSYYVKGA